MQQRSSWRRAASAGSSSRQQQLAAGPPYLVPQRARDSVPRWHMSAREKTCIHVQGGLPLRPVSEPAAPHARGFLPTRSLPPACHSLCPARSLFTVLGHAVLQGVGPHPGCHAAGQRLPCGILQQ